MNNSIVNAGICNPAASGLPAARGICCLFARVLDYPSPELPAQVQDLVSQVSALNPEAADPLMKFAAESQGMTLGQLQELYTSTFDMRPDRTTNLGCHLFGEDIRRNLFMTQLKDRMYARHVQTGTELPDHLSLVLELLAREDSEDEVQTLITDCLEPAITRILSTFDGAGSTDPYTKVLQALLAFLHGNRIVPELPETP